MGLLSELLDELDEAIAAEDREEASEVLDRLRERAEGLERRLREAADLMASTGRIHNTPGAKLRWMEGN